MFISETLKKSWDIAKKDFFFFLGIILTYVAIIAVLAYLFNYLLVIPVIISQIIYIIILCWIEIGLVIIALKKAKGEDTSFGDLFSGAKYLAAYMGAYILYILIIIAGTILLVVPSVIWGIKYMFFPYLIIDKKMKAIEALKTSAKITYGTKWDILGFWCVIGLVQIIGLLCLLLGLLWAIPTTWVASATLYLKLAEKSN